MKAEILERSNILNFSCDIITISLGWGQKTYMWISNTYVIANSLLTS